MQRYLILEDGSVFEGQSFGATTVSTGQLMLNTATTGYQEIITDQAYNGQIIAFTYPMIGNTGINRDQFESINPSCRGVVVHQTTLSLNSQKSLITLDEYLKRQQIPGIYDIDTRRLARLIRQKGNLKASIVDAADEHAFDQLTALVLPKNQVQQVSTVKAYPSPATGYNVVVIDLGLKNNILRELTKRNCNVTVVPYQITAQEIYNLDPDGVLISSGPGKVKAISEVVTLIQTIQADIPLLAIGLGHEAFAVANGAKLAAFEVGQGGTVFPTQDIATGAISFVTQNHQYYVDETTVDKQQLLITHRQLTTNLIDGLRHRHLPAFSVQFYPESAPGSHHNLQVFDAFIELLETQKNHQKGQ